MYGISSKQNYANLRAIDKRRKRAICILVNCADGLSLYRKKTYWTFNFSESYETIFSDFIDERKSCNLALATINRDIYTLNHFQNIFSFQVYQILRIYPQKSYKDL